MPGAIRASISGLSDVCEDGIIPWVWLETWQREPGRLQRDIWRILVGGRSQGGTTAPNWCRRAFEHTFGPVAVGSGGMGAKGLLNLADMIETHQKSNIADFLRRVSACVWGRRLLASTRDRPGYFGIVPKEAAPGGMVCLLQGCSVPVVFRGKPMKELALQSLQHMAGSQGTAGLGLTPAAEAKSVSRMRGLVSRILSVPDACNPIEFKATFLECAERSGYVDAINRLLLQSLPAKPIRGPVPGDFRALFSVLPAAGVGRLVRCDTASPGGAGGDG